MSTLADVLGLKNNEAYEFDSKIVRLESKIADQTNIIAGFTAKIYENSTLGLRSIGFERGEVTGQEAFSALKNLAQKGDNFNEGFWRDHQSTIFFTVDGLVSANRQDVEQSLVSDLGFSERRFDNARQNILKNLAELYAKKISYSAEEIIEDLTN